MKTDKPYIPRSSFIVLFPPLVIWGWKFQQVEETSCIWVAIILQLFEEAERSSFLSQLPKTTALVAALGSELLVWPVQQELN